MKLTMAKFKQLVREACRIAIAKRGSELEESGIDGAGGSGAGTHHAMAGVRFGRGRGTEREWRSKSGLDPHIMDEADGSDPRMGADMYTHGYKFSHEPERQRRGHTGGTRDVDDPGHPIFIYEDDEDTESAEDLMMPVTTRRQRLAQMNKTSGPDDSLSARVKRVKLPKKQGKGQLAKLLQPAAGAGISFPKGGIKVKSPRIRFEEDKD